MLDSTGKPRRELLKWDGLHPSPSGCALRSGALHSFSWRAVSYIRLIFRQHWLRRRTLRDLRGAADARGSGAKAFSISSRSQRFAGSFSTLSCQYK